MNFSQALASFRREQFTDHDVMRCTGLSLRAWRELIRKKALYTISGRGQGCVRRCDATAFKRAAAIAVINCSGLSLSVSGQIAFFWPFHTLLYTVYDPRTILLQGSADSHLMAGPLAGSAQPKVDWFDPEKPAKAEELDWKIAIYDGRFVGAIYGANSKPVIFGDLREKSSRFVAWHPSQAKAQVAGSAVEILAHEVLPHHRFVDFVADYEDPSKVSKQLKSLGYEWERRESVDPVRMIAEDATRNALSIITINVSLALRKALRRYLEIELVEPVSEYSEGQ